MRQRLVLLTLLLISSLLCHAQETSDIFKPSMPVLWLGLDFSEVKFIGDRERLGSESDIRHLMEAMNNLIITEQDKYTIASAIERTSMNNDITVTSEHNAALDLNGRHSTNAGEQFHLKPVDIQKIVSSYNFKGNKGIGLMFNMESMSKISESASLYVTFVNMANKEILFTQRLSAPPSGFGLRNYWSGAIYQMIKKIKKKEFEMWRRKNS